MKTLVQQFLSSPQGTKVKQQLAQVKKERGQIAYEYMLVQLDKQIAEAMCKHQPTNTKTKQ